MNKEMIKFRLQLAADRKGNVMVYNFGAYVLKEIIPNYKK